jgi:hypothetical protein
MDPWARTLDVDLEVCGDDVVGGDLSRSPTASCSGDCSHDIGGGATYAASKPERILSKAGQAGHVTCRRFQALSATECIAHHLLRGDRVHRASFASRRQSASRIICFEATECIAHHLLRDACVCVCVYVNLCVFMYVSTSECVRVESIRFVFLAERQQPALQMEGRRISSAHAMPPPV